MLADGAQLPVWAGAPGIPRVRGTPALSHGGVVNGFVSVLADFPGGRPDGARLVNTRLLHPGVGDPAHQLGLGAVFNEPSNPWTSPGDGEGWR